jgi:hypothetical protein
LYHSARLFDEVSSSRHVAHAVYLNCIRISNIRGPWFNKRIGCCISYFLHVNKKSNNFCRTAGSSPPDSKVTCLPIENRGCPIKLHLRIQQSPRRGTRTSKWFKYISNQMPSKSSCGIPLADKVILITNNLNHWDTRNWTDSVDCVQLPFLVIGHLNL